MISILYFMISPDRFYTYKRMSSGPFVCVHFTPFRMASHIKVGNRPSICHRHLHFVQIRNICCSDHQTINSGFFQSARFYTTTQHQKFEEKIKNKNCAKQSKNEKYVGKIEQIIHIAPHRKKTIIFCALYNTYELTNMK